MKELPLNDKQWLDDHIMFSDIPNKHIEMDLTNLSLIYVPHVTNVTHRQLTVGFGPDEQKPPKDEKIIFVDNKTKELYWYQMTSTDICCGLKMRLMEALVDAGLITNKQFKCFTMYTRFIIIGEAYKVQMKSKSDLAREYTGDNYDKSKLTSSMTSTLSKYIVEKSYNSNIKGIINSIIDESNDTILLSEFEEKLHSIFKNNFIENVEKSKDQISIKYLLLRYDVRFSGNFKLNTSRYQDNKNVNTFDTVEIEINMMNNYEDNLSFIKSNIKKVKLLLKKMIETDNRTKEYANFLKCYSLVLTKGNILLAKFCFKDGLETKEKE